MRAAVIAATAAVAATLAGALWGVPGASAPEPAAAAAPAADRAAAQRAARWLMRRPAAGMPGGQQADAIVALRAAGAPPRALAGRAGVLAATAPDYARTPGAAGKVVMAAVAAGRDPRRLGGVDYVRRVSAGGTGGRYGASTFDQSLAMLALRAAGRPVPRPAVRVLLGARGTGGWGFVRSPRGADSVDATALALEALRAAGVPARSPALRAATRWMLAQRNAEGGFASAGRGRPTEANATAGAIRALRAMGMTPPPRARAALRRLQERSGAIRFTRASPGSRLLATNDALVALSGAHLPVR